MIMHAHQFYLYKMKDSSVLPTGLQGNYRDSLGEFNSESCGVC